MTHVEPNSAPAVHRFSHDAMACTFELAIAGQEQLYASQAAAAAWEEVDRLERELSRFIEHSDISRINAIRPGQWVRVGTAARECLELAQAVFAQTGGAFDVTVGALLHKQDPAAARPSLLGTDWLQISAAHAGVGLRAGADGRVSIDLGAVGKGYALDQIAALLLDWGIEDVLLHSGQSTALARGRSPGDTGWPLAVRDPEDHDKSIAHMRLTECALSGSGRKLHGSHILDPRSGEPVTDRVGTWAIAPTAALSDALSTAFFVMTADEVEAYCASHPEIAAMVILGAGAERQTRVMGAWEKYVEGE